MKPNPPHHDPRQGGATSAPRRPRLPERRDRPVARSLASRTALVSAAGLVNALASTVTGIVLARLLGAEEVGHIALALWVSGTAVTVAELGLPMALQRYLPELEAQGRQGEARAFVQATFRIMVLSITLVAVLTGLLWVAGPFKHDGDVAHASATMTALVLACFVGQALSAFYVGCIRGLQRFGEWAVVSLMSAGLQVSALTLGSIVSGAPGAIAGYVAGALAPALLGVRLGMGAGRLPSGLRTRVLRFASLTWITNIVSGLIWTRTELVFLEAFSGSRSAGLFATAATVAGLATFLPALMTGALLPYFSEQIGRGARDRMERVFKAMVFVLAVFSLPACFGLVAIAPVLVPLLFGPTFAEAIPAVRVLSFSATFAVIAAVTPNILYRLERNALLLATNALGLLLAVALGFVVIREYGLLGAAWSRAAVHGLVVTLETWYVARHLAFAIPFGSLARITAAAATCGTGAGVVTQAIEGSWSLIVAVPAGAAIYLLALRAFRAVSPSDAAFLDAALAGAPAVSQPALRAALAFVRAQPRGGAPD